MNPIVIVHLIGAIFAIGVSIPLVAGRVTMNHWYGIRVPQAFESNERWFEINRYGGRLTLFWGVAMALMAAIGAFLDRQIWVAYDWSALIVIFGGLAVVVFLISRHARHRDSV